MSLYVIAKTAFKDQECLLKALADVGFGQGKVEICNEPKKLEGYQGDLRDQKAHIILRRKHVGAYSNDIGFARLPDGTYQAYISAYDKNRYGDAWTKKLTQAYAKHKTIKVARSFGYTQTQTKVLPNGKIVVEATR